jgi:iron complex transport system substrate-binding protein
VRRIWLLLLPLLAAPLAACGDDAAAPQDPATSAPATSAPVDEAGPTGDGTFPVTVPDGVGGEVTIEARPERIVSLSATATEMLFAIGAGDQVVAVDEFSDFPAEAPTTDLSGFTPNLEAIAAYEPDLAVIAFDPGELVSGLSALGVPVLYYGPAMTLDDSYAQIEQLGAATGNLDGAVTLVGEMVAAIQEIVADLPPLAEPVRVYHELDDTFYSATSATFIGELYTLLGLANIADAADPDGSSFGYPQLNPEFIIEADPELVVITDDIGYGTDDVAARPGWDTIGAVQRGNVVQVDGDLSSRWGPRVVLFLEQIAARIATLEPAAG